MKTLYMTKGLPASGKSTWAKAKGKELGNCKRINKDDLRAMLDNGRWSGHNEKFILEARNTLIKLALQSSHVIVDDTNFAPIHEEYLRGLAKSRSVNFELVDFTQVPLETCLERDRHRSNYVGEKVIKDMYNKYLKPKDAAAPPRNPRLPDCIIVDIDGTVAHNDGHRGWYEWEKVGKDLPRDLIINTIKALYDYANVRDLIFVSGRDESCREQTVTWLTTNGLGYFGGTLFMRPAGDMRKDSIVKREIYDQHIKDKYNVVAIFDDRKSVLRMWEDLGFSDRIFNVGKLDEKF